MQSPFGIAVDGKVYSLVGEYRYCGQLNIFSPEGKLIHSVGNLQHNAYVWIDNDSNIFITSQTDWKVYKFWCVKFIQYIFLKDFQCITRPFIKNIKIDKFNFWIKLKEHDWRESR